MSDTTPLYISYDTDTSSSGVSEFFDCVSYSDFAFEEEDLVTCKDYSDSDSVFSDDSLVPKFNTLSLSQNDTNRLTLNYSTYHSTDQVAHNSIESLEVIDKETDSLQVDQENSIENLEIFDKETDSLQVEQENSIENLEIIDKETDSLQVDQENSIENLEIIDKETDSLQVEQENSLENIEIIDKETDSLQVDQENSLENLEIIDKETDSLQVEQEKLSRKI
ncbi:hypothetical protein P9112_014007 [Eukaryota sp. TZLM1-RC]